MARGNGLALEGGCDIVIENSKKYIFMLLNSSNKKTHEELAALRESQ